MKIGVIHYNFPQFTFEQFLDYCPKAGFGYVEVQISDVWGPGVDDPEANAKKVAAQLRERGLAASALSAGNDFVVLGEDEIAAQVDRLTRIMRLICGCSQCSWLLSKTSRK